MGMGREAREVAVAGEEVRSGEWWEAAMAWVWWEEVMAGEWWEAVMAGAWWVEVTARWLLLARSSSSSLTRSISASARCLYDSWDMRWIWRLAARKSASARSL